jgi:DNA-binding transcriptional ArsR family regulator
MVQYAKSIDSAFAAIADPTRRGVLELLARREATITELAERFEMTLTGMKKHVQVLETVGLVASAKIGRVRTCRLGPRRLEQEMQWLEQHRAMLEQRLDSLEAFLERTQDEEEG